MSSAARRIIRIADDFRLQRGGTLAEVNLAYETWGRRNEHDNNSVLLFTGLSPSAHAASSPEDPEPGWWEWMIGPGRPLDTDRYHVICVNSLGSCFGSTGPASIDPATGRPYGCDFPELSIEDIARAAHELVKLLGIGRLHTVMGASLGGMAALAYALEFPHAAERLVSLCAAMRAEPAAVALRSLQREIICADPAWHNGRYEPGAGPLEGMRLARKLGMISYRSAQEWAQRFERDETAAGELDAPFAAGLQVEAYLEANARRFVERFDPNCYLYLSRAMDWFDAGDLAGIAIQRALVIGVETDKLFPVHQQRELADRLCELGRDVEFVAMPSLQGHDAFLVDRGRFAPVLRKFFSDDLICVDDERISIRDCVAAAG